MTPETPDDSSSRVVDVQLFAGAKEAAGVEVVCVLLGATDQTFGDLARCLVAQYGELEPLMPHSRFAADNAYVSSEASLQNVREIALIPPVSGG